ncbi:MAG: hypothetical protein HYU67_08320 [Flavobacteriia bacterium]|nr:hypothetical protein [Flavobacteriia bacterium]
MKKIIETNQNLLIEKRREQLNKINESGLRAYGKVMGMDMFLWLNPSPIELQNTLNSFPDPIIWFGNNSDIIQQTKDTAPWNKKTFLLCSYDGAGFTMSNSLLDEIKNVLGTKKIEDALDLIPSLYKKQACFLFTVSGENNEFYFKKITQFIEKFKIA